MANLLTSKTGAVAIKITHLTGRCADGAERDKGKLRHAGPQGRQVAPCGAKPGRRSAGWHEPGDAIDHTDHPVNCPRCLKKLARLQGEATTDGFSEGNGR